MTELFASSLDLMMVGMGTVFAFLTLLIFATNLMSKFVVWITPEPPVPPATTPKASNTAADDEQLIAVITAAIQQHRKNPKK